MNCTGRTLSLWEKVARNEPGEGGAQRRIADSLGIKNATSLRSALTRQLLRCAQALPPSPGRRGNSDFDTTQQRLWTRNRLVTSQFRILRRIEHPTVFAMIEGVNGQRDQEQLK